MNQPAKADELPEASPLDKIRAIIGINRRCTWEPLKARLLELLKAEAQLQGRPEPRWPVSALAEICYAIGCPMADPYRAPFAPIENRLRDLM